MRLYSIASGSSGNCIYVGDKDTHILIDVGISKKRIEEGLKLKDINPFDIDAIFITHEHSDHISGLGVISRKYNIPIYATKETIDYIRFMCSNVNGCKGGLGVIDESLFNVINVEEEILIKDLKIKPFHIYHDALDPVGYKISSETKSVAVATDIGHFDEYIIDVLSDLDAILIEANHDIRMLEISSYPYSLKQRILSDSGHMCNEVCGCLLNNIVSPRLKKIILGHLSKENNFPELALRSVCNEINNGKHDYKADDFDIEVARRDCPSAYYEI